MMTVDVFEARNHFADLLDRVQRGEDVVLTRDGVPVGRLEALPPVSGDHVASAVAALGTHWESHTFGCHRWAVDG